MLGVDVLIVFTLKLVDESSAMPLCIVRLELSREEFDVCVKISPLKQ